MSKRVRWGNVGMVLCVVALVACVVGCGAYGMILLTGGY